MYHTYLPKYKVSVLHWYIMLIYTLSCYGVSYKARTAGGFFYGTAIVRYIIRNNTYLFFLIKKFFIYQKKKKILITVVRWLHFKYSLICLKKNAWLHYFLSLSSQGIVSALFKNKLYAFVSLEMQFNNFIRYWLYCS